METIGPVDGLETCESALDHADTVQRVKEQLVARGMTIFAHVDHAAGAFGAGMTLSPTDLILFGNPAAGTFLMQERQTAGIDLPLKLLVWTPPEGVTRLSYDRPCWIGDRHHIRGAATSTVARMADLLASIAAGIRA
jgi:uncharacterized protein (DUF302 family)